MKTIEEFKDFILFSSVLTTSEIDAIKLCDSSKLHFSFGMLIRNSWNLWENDDSKKNELVKFFNSWGIYHADDMSAIILESLKILFNDKNADIKFEKQVKFYKNFWKKQGFKDGIYKVNSEIKVVE